MVTPLTPLRRSVLLLAVLCLFVAGACRTTPGDYATQFAQPIEKIHGLDQWQEQNVLQTDIVVQFGGNDVIDGTMWMATKSAQSRLELADGTVAVFDGERAWVAPPEMEFPRARFHLLTWPYFLAAPFKLRDPGTLLQPMPDMKVLGEEHEVAQLTFDEGTGDTPDDWYLVYKDEDTDHLRALAYIVTYGTPKMEAEEEPHAVLYEDLVRQNGVTIPTEWTFYNWSPERGFHGDPIGKVFLENLRFVTPEPGAFDRPENAREDALPPMNR